MPKESVKELQNAWVDADIKAAFGVICKKHKIGKSDAIESLMQMFVNEKVYVVNGTATLQKPFFKGAQYTRGRIPKTE